MRKKVVVAMSGGVDSSVAALLLKDSDFDVTGLTMCLGIKTYDDKVRCCGQQAIEDAKRVCNRLDIPHYTMDFSKDLEENVVSKFVSEYLKGRTPNPCVDCNRFLKFGALFKKAFSMGFDFVATGHYARVAQLDNNRSRHLPKSIAGRVAQPANNRSRHLPKSISGRVAQLANNRSRYLPKSISGRVEENDGSFILKRAKDRRKDQSYFLYAVNKEALKSILFPLGELTKEEVRDIARGAKLPVADKAQSQDICFIPKGGCQKFMSQRVKDIKPGDIVDSDGNIRGIHKGIFYYTVGQRKGMGICGSRPLYVLSIDGKKNRIVVGEKKDLKARGLVAENLNLLVDNLPDRALAKIRYAHKESECEIFLQENLAKVIFKEKQEAITPGQSVVFYDGDVVLGGGVIGEVLW